MPIPQRVFRKPGSWAAEFQETVRTMIFHILQVGKLRHRAIQQDPQDHLSHHDTSKE